MLGRETESHPDLSPAGVPEGHSEERHIVRLRVPGEQPGLSDADMADRDVLTRGLLPAEGRSGLG